ncbi:MAG: hypothetical protein AAF710_06175 [Planctomycetota bacterium]
MQVILDELPVTLTGPSLGALLEEARDRLADGGRVVVEVAVDGAKLDEDAIDRRRAEDVAAYEVRLTSADPKALAVETLRQVDERLTDAETAQREAADLLQSDEPQPALKKVGESIEAWLQVQQAVLHSATLLGLNLDAIDIDGEPAHALTEQALDRLNDVKDHLQAGDTVALADSLAHEWPATTAKWHRLIERLIQQITPTA